MAPLVRSSNPAIRRARSKRARAAARSPSRLREQFQAQKPGDDSVRELLGWQQQLDRRPHRGLAYRRSGEVSPRRQPGRHLFPEARRASVPTHSVVWFTAPMSRRPIPRSTCMSNRFSVTRVMRAMPHCEPARSRISEDRQLTSGQRSARDSRSLRCCRLRRCRGRGPAPSIAVHHSPGPKSGLAPARWRARIRRSSRWQERRRHPLHG